MQLLDTGLDASKTVDYKAGDYLGNKIANALLSKTLATLTNSNDDNIITNDGKYYKNGTL